MPEGRQGEPVQDQHFRSFSRVCAKLFFYRLKPAQRRALQARIIRAPEARSGRQMIIRAEPAGRCA